MSPVDAGTMMPTEVPWLTSPWPAPAIDKVALSVDGPYCLDDGLASTGMNLRRHGGSVLFAAYKFTFDCNDALEAELHALIQGMALRIQHSKGSIIVQSDYSKALSCLYDNRLPGRHMVSKLQRSRNTC